jgi:WhiB family redox-sensing transcriptional regulator
MNWRQEASCLTRDPELFFPVGNTGGALRQINRAKAICAECPVRVQCLRWAVDSGVDHGVWGGWSEDERRSLKRRTSRSRARTS